MKFLKSKRDRNIRAFPDRSGYKQLDKSLKALVEIIHFTEKVSTKIHGVLDETEIYRIVKEEFANSRRYTASIVLLTDDGSKLKVVESSLPIEKLRFAEKVAGARLKGYEIDLNKSRIYSQVAKEGKTVQVDVNEVIQELFPQPVAHLISRITGYRKKASVLTPLRRGEKIIGVFAMSSTDLVRYFIPSVKNLAQHISSALELYEEHTERKKAEEEILYRSHYDEVTGLYNRAFFEEELRRLNTERQLPLSIIIGDVNGLKLVNDAFGHLEGDKLLRRIAQGFRGACREEDVIARWGGDEFIVLLPKTDEKTAMKVCTRIKGSCYELSKTAIPLSIALGLATKGEVNQNLQEVIMKAEDRMYTNKLLNERSIRNAIIFSLQNTLEERSHETREHTKRLQKLALRMGHYLELPDNEIDLLELLAALHDIGKVAIPNHILTKPGILSLKEWKEMKKHSEIGYRIIKSFPELTQVAEAILAHHEWWNGKGYPRGLKGKKIPLISRIIAIIDAYDVMTHGQRPYKKRISSQKALEELQKNAGSQFDPKLVKIFVKMMSEFST